MVLIHYITKNTILKCKLTKAKNALEYYYFFGNLPLQPISISEENLDPLIVIFLCRVNDRRAVDLHAMDRLYHLKRKDLSVERLKRIGGWRDFQKKSILRAGM